MGFIKSKKLGIALLLGTLLLILAACGNDEKASNGNKDGDATKIRVGMVCGGMTPIVAQIGIYDGSFEKVGLDVEEVCFNSGSDAIAALVSGSIDMNLGSYEHVLKMANNNLGIKAFASLNNGVGYSLVVKNDSNINSLTDLKGKTLAVTKAGSLSDTGLRKGLEQAGLNPAEDVNIIGSGSGATMFAAIDSGQVAGGMVSEPTVSQMVSTGDYKVLLDPEFEYAGIVVMSKTEFVNKNKEAVQKLFDELQEIHKRAKADAKSVVTTMQSKFENIPADVLETAISNQMAKVPEGLIISEAAAQTVNETAIQLELIDKPVPFADAIDLSFVKGEK